MMWKKYELRFMIFKIMNELYNWPKPLTLLQTHLEQTGLCGIIFSNCWGDKEYEAFNSIVIEIPCIMTYVQPLCSRHLGCCSPTTYNACSIYVDSQNLTTYAPMCYVLIEPVSINVHGYGNMEQNVCQTWVPWQR